MILCVMFLKDDTSWNKKAGRNLRKFTISGFSLNESNADSHIAQSPQQQVETAKGITDEKYLLPVLVGNQGFNNQLQALKLISIFAHKRNFTIVLSPFFEHQSQPELQQPRTFEESIDGEILGKFVSAITLHEFKERCNNTVQAMFAGTNMVRNQSRETTNFVHNFVERSLRVFHNHTGIHIPSLISNVNNSDVVIRITEELPYGVPVDYFLDRYPDSLTTTKKCNAFLYPYGYLSRLHYWVHIQRYNNFFVRSKKVRTMAKHFSTHVLKSNPYVCIHWRFSTEWKQAWWMERSFPIAYPYSAWLFYVLYIISFSVLYDIAVCCIMNIK